jgi:hypothetical protein
MLDFIVLTLAASALVDVWRNGSIFALGRAVLESRADEEYALPGSESSWPGSAPAPWLWRTIPLFFAKMLNCHFCFSHHTPWVLALLFFFPALWLDGVWAWLAKLPVYSLAATRLGTIINAYVPEDAKYERSNVTPFIEDHNDEPFSSA